MRLTRRRGIASTRTIVVPLMFLPVGRVGLIVGRGRGWTAAAIVTTLLVVVAYLIPIGHPDVRRATGSHGTDPSRFDGVRVWRDLRYAADDDARVDVYGPTPRTGRIPGVVVVHGGAWRDGDKARMNSVSRRLARSGLIAYSVNYALADSSRPGFPTQLRQLRSAVRWARRSSSRFGLNRKRLGALGTSAGGHLASLLGIKGRGPLHKGTRVRAVSAWSAPFDLGPLTETRMATSINTFLGCLSVPCPDRQVAASPITHVSNGDPPMLILNSRDERVPASQARRMAHRLSGAGVPQRLRLLDGSAHAMEYADRAIRPTIRFLRQWLRAGRLPAG